jgi:GST-like protein
MTGDRAATELYGRVEPITIRLLLAPEKLPYAVDRYQKETLRLLSVLARQLATHPLIAGEYSIADIATFPWIASASSPNMGLSLTQSY